VAPASSTTFCLPPLLTGSGSPSSMTRSNIFLQKLGCYPKLVDFDICYIMDNDYFS
jgi:hypothetical protein